MAYIKLEQFSGISPRTAPTQLTPNQAQVANNVRVSTKGLDSWRKEVLAYTPTNPITLGTIYRMNNLSSGASKWLGWVNDVDVVVGPVGDTTEGRIYYTGDGVPKKTNWALATTSGGGVDPFPNAWLNMGVPNPTGAPTLAASSATAPSETRAYVYTNVSQFGAVYEESGPSPATIVNVSSASATVTVSGFTAVPTTNYNITKRRIYRTITGASTVVYSMVAEIPLSTTSYVDSVAVISLGQVLPSLVYAPPPAGLLGLTAMPNGILAGFTGNQVWFCEPYLPHAWPTNYMMTVNDEIVGLATYDQSLVVLTKHQPFVITGTTPGSMTQTKLPMMQPCVSKRSIATDQYGILYASPNGIVSIGNGSSDVVTTSLYTRQEWELLMPATMFGRVYNNMYIAFGSNGTGGVAAIVISRGDIPPLFTLDFPAAAIYIEHSTGAIYVVSTVDNNIYQLDADDLNQTFYEWKSKRFVVASPTNFGAMKIEADYTKLSNVTTYNANVAAIVASNNALFSANPLRLQGAMNTHPLNKFQLNGSVLATIPAIAGTKSINFFLYADGVLMHQGGSTSNEPFRLPAGRKSYEFEIKLTGNAPISGLVMASTIGELRNVPNG